MLRLLDEFEAFIVVTEDASAYRHPSNDAIVMDAVDRWFKKTNVLALFGAANAESDGQGPAIA